MLLKNSVSGERGRGKYYSSIPDLSSRFTSSRVASDICSEDLLSSTAVDAIPCVALFIFSRERETTPVIIRTIAFLCTVLLEVEYL